MSDFHFLRPLFLYAFIPFLILGVFLLRKKYNGRAWSQICSDELMPYVLSVKTNHSNFLYILMCVTFSLLIFAAAGPSWQTIAVPLTKSQSGLVVALDLSKTMDSQDIKPSRLKRAIFKLNDILDVQQEGFTALLVFSDDAYVVTPMTDDTSTIKAMMPALETKIMPTNGHNPVKAISKGIDLLHQAGISNGSILLMTSELSKSDRGKAIEIASRENVKIFVLGIGTDQATPIQNEDGGFIKDSKGALLISMLSKDNLQFLAEATKGAYTTISADDSDVNYLTRKIKKSNNHEENESTELSQNQWHDQGYLFVLFALPFVTLIFRRGVLLLLLFIFPYHLQALTWNDLWKTADQQAEQLFHQEKFEEAQDKFQNIDWKAASHYRTKDFETAAELYSHDQTIDGLYNYGTAKAKQGDFQSALEAYRQALKIDPEHEDTIFNKKLIEDALKNDQNQNTNEQQNNSNDQKNQSDKQDQSNSDQSSDDQNNSDQNNSQNNQTNDNKQNDDPKDSQSDQKQDNNEDDKQAQNDKHQNDHPSTPQNDKPESGNDKSGSSEKMNENDKEKIQEQYRNEVEEQLNKQENKNAANPVEFEETDKEANEQQQINERLLQRIKDDPSNLLRRKFLMQSQEQNKGYK